MGDGSGGHVSPQRTDLDPGAAQVDVDNLIGERDAHRVEIHSIRNRPHIAAFNGAYQRKQIVDRPCEIADPNQSKNGDDPDRVTHDDQRRFTARALRVRGRTRRACYPRTPSSTRRIGQRPS